jgi:mlo protein
MLDNKVFCHIKQSKVVLCKNVFKNEHGESNRPALFQGDVPLLSLEALHQLHIFIFVLGLVHVVFCATTISFSGAKVYM